ncbi:hypothetical protein [Streptomyces olivaceoviridis]|uniref:hypothetical protein n=1 Tax=Streptomyces olivaceoviridis TaxID=1921 RepID=UPI0036BEA6F3
MTDHDHHYIADLAAQLANVDANEINAAQAGDNQLGHPIPKHPGLRTWHGPLRIGHIDQNLFVLEVNALLPDDRHVTAAFHHWVRREHLTPPPGYDDDPTDLQWVYCAADAPGAIPITNCVIEVHDDADD